MRQKERIRCKTWDYFCDFKTVAYRRRDTIPCSVSSAYLYNSTLIIKAMWRLHLNSVAVIKRYDVGVMNDERESAKISLFYWRVRRSVSNEKFVCDSNWESWKCEVLWNRVNEEIRQRLKATTCEEKTWDVTVENVKSVWIKSLECDSDWQSDEQ